MEIWIQFLVTIVCSMFASSGLWAIIAKKAEKKDSRTALIIGLAHDRIMGLGMMYLERGWMTPDEYENLTRYLYEPYAKLGGNGSAERIIREVNEKVEIRSVNSFRDDGH